MTTKYVRPCSTKSFSYIVFFSQENKLKMSHSVMFMNKGEAAVAEREEAPPQQLRLRQQQRRTMGLRDREAVAAAVSRYHRRLFLYLGLFHGPGPGPSPFRVNSASLASLCCSLSFPGKPGVPEGRYCPYRRRGIR